MEVTQLKNSHNNIIIPCSTMADTALLNEDNTPCHYPNGTVTTVYLINPSKIEKACIIN